VHIVLFLIVASFVGSNIAADLSGKTGQRHDINVLHLIFQVSECNFFAIVISFTSVLFVSISHLFVGILF